MSLSPGHCGHLPCCENEGPTDERDPFGCCNCRTARLEREGVLCALCGHAKAPGSGRYGCPNCFGKGVGVQADAFGAASPRPVLVLTPEESAGLAKILENPPEPTQALRDAMRRYAGQAARVRSEGAGAEKCERLVRRGAT